MSRFSASFADDRSPFVVELGSRRAARLGVGNKGTLLDRAAAARLPVPPGFILLDAAWQHALREGLVVVEDGQVCAPEPARLVAALRLQPFITQLQAPCLAVRSAFSLEDGADESLSGYFVSQLRVPSDDPAQLAAALCAVWTSALRRPGTFRHDVLMMAMVEARHAGAAFTERAFEDDEINYTEGTADQLLSGGVEGQSMLLPKLRPWERMPPAAQMLHLSVRVQDLLRAVRQVFGPDDWDIEWADDGTRCLLVQVRPITRPPRRNEIFTIANHKEILPELPSTFMTSLIASCAADLFAYYRRFDPDLPTTRPFIEVFYGRPLINLSLLTDMMRAWGLPTRLVTDTIGGATERDYGLNLPRVFRKTPVLLRQGFAQLRAVADSRRTRTALLERTAQPGTSFSACIDTLRWVYTALVTDMFALTAAMSAPLMLLRRAGVLEEHNARQRTISTRMFADLEPLRALAAQDVGLRSALERGDLPDNVAFRAAWETFLAQHGHRGVYESDIARPRLRERPQDVLQSLAHPLEQRRPLPPRTMRGWLTLPIWWQGSRALRAREQLRSHAMRAVERIRTALLALADRAVADGALPDREALWLLSIDEARSLDEGWRPAPAFFIERIHAIERLKGYQLPDRLCRFDDLEQYRFDQSPTGATRRFFGISLTTGEVRGRAWVLSEPQTALPKDLQPEDAILVARSVDAGWIPTFGRVAGVVVETGGDLSHGSIILRELGLPAITNVRGATRAIKTGDALLLRAGSGAVELL